MDSVDKDLKRWMPSLLAVWRRLTGKKGGPPDRLLQEEIRDVVRGVKTLSAGLKGDRKLISTDYMDNPDLLGAYLLFYWPVSYAQGRYALAHLHSRPKCVLDLGSGPAPISFASLDHGAGEVTAADRSEGALKAATSLAGEKGEPLAVRKWDPLKGERIPEGTFDLIIMGHFLNEIWGDDTGEEKKKTALVERCFESVRKGGSVIIIEPALLLTSRRLLRLRDLLITEGYKVGAPCLFQGGCPALAREGNTCHTDREWTPPAMVKDISRLAGLHRDALKMSFLVLRDKNEKWPELPPGRLFRIVSDMLESNKRMRLIGCGPEGRIGISLTEQGFSESNRIFTRLKRGDVIAVSGAEDRESGIVLNPESSIKIVSHAGKPLPGAWEWK